ncbi:DUF5753 domain-containing protein [Prauserella muralis]|uniref:DUF5753 domain-containing protein n=1 Tax=Prauserella muralis TaxID=588067 RepID=A0A2V4AHM1_9PSEU|nr:DUF5753 domain-containing protein [Prauserella muralis]PXY19432.1 hypothetical protein BAY60_32340 [Prauserella muralis]TWE29407.1 hypothetical protein FHX69_2092 [Prauserella muralis]
MVEPGKTAVRRAIGRQLKRMRNDRGINLSTAAKVTENGPKALMQVERGRNLPQLADIEALLSTYNHSEQIPHFQHVLTEAGANKPKDWWERRFPAEVVGEQAKLLLSCEASAVELMVYQAQLVPDLFRTAGYAEAVLRAEDPELDDEEAGLGVSLVQGRQEVLERADAPRITCVLDEAALRRRVGGTDVLRAQLEHLAELARRPRIDIRVLTDDLGAHPGSGGSFTRIVLLPELPTYPGIVHVKVGPHDVYYEEPDEIAPFDTIFARLREQALPADESLAAIEEAARRD